MRSHVRSSLPVVLFLGLIVCISSAFGAGFALYEGSARGNAMGGAVVAGGDGPASMFYNAAGMTQCTGFEAQVGGTLIRPSIKVETMDATGATETTETEENNFFPPHLYAVYGINDMVYAGFGIYSRFGLGTEFDEDWPGRYNSYNAEITTLSLNPNVAVKVMDKLSLAAGFSAMYFDLTLKRKLPGPAGDLDFKLQGDSWGYGYNLGARYEAFDWMALGVSYQSAVEQSLEGEAEVEMVGETDASGDVTLPDMVGLGVAFKPIEKVTLELGAVYTRWSTYDELTIEFDNPALLGTAESTSEKDWKNVWRYQVGLEYQLTEQVQVRFGYDYDQEPTPDKTVDYLLPANDRQLFNLGVGYAWKTWTLDLSYTYLMIEDRDIQARPAEGIAPSEVKDGYTHMIGLTLGKEI